MEISLRHTGGARFSAEARHHRVWLDQPAEDGATDQGMTPAELLLASLGGCVGQYVVQYLGVHGLPSDGLAVRVAAQPTAKQLHLGDFSVEVVVPGLSSAQLRALEKSFGAGLVQNALRIENQVRVTVGSGATGSKP